MLLLVGCLVAFFDYFAVSVFRNCYTQLTKLILVKPFSMLEVLINARFLCFNFNFHYVLRFSHWWKFLLPRRS